MCKKCIFNIKQLKHFEIRADRSPLKTREIWEDWSLQFGEIEVPRVKEDEQSAELTPACFARGGRVAVAV